MKFKRLVVVAVAGAAALSLSACSGAEGGRAAQVGDATISTSDVDFLTRMQCDALDAAAKDGQQAQTVPTRLVRSDMVNALVLSEINAQLAEEGDGDYDTATYRQAMDDFEQAVQAAPAEDRDRFRELVGDFYKGQLQVFALAKAKLASVGFTEPGNDELSQAVESLQGNYRDQVEITVDPVYGPDDKGNAGVQDGSLSKAISKYAKQAASSQPDPQWIAGLPAGQRCG